MFQVTWGLKVVKLQLMKGVKFHYMNSYDHMTKSVFSHSNSAMKVIVVLSLILFLIIQPMSINASLVLLSLDDSSRILARIGNDSTRTSEQDGRRQEDNYDDGDGGDDEYYAYDDDSYEDIYYDEDDNTCKTSRDCGRNARCNRRTGLCVCRSRAYGRFPQCCRIPCEARRKGRCDGQTRRCTKPDITLRPVTLRPVTSSPGNS